jgi:uncharacterized protein YggU (UPF0235/DUF167 family)
LIRLAGAPVNGHANETLTTFLATTLGVTVSAVTILHGHRTRDKKVRIRGLSAAGINARLAPYLSVGDA